MATTERYEYGNLFSITVCQHCFNYRIDHDPDMVFHNINARYLMQYRDGIITPKGKPNAPHYHAYLDKRYLHLGPLCISGLITEEDYLIFGFDVHKLKAHYPQAKYLAFDI